MKCLPKDSILKFNPTTLEDVRKEFNLHKPGDMEAAVNILEEWVKQQEHFVKKKFDKHYLEYMIILSKGSLERAKTRIDKLCTVRTLIPNVFEDYDVRNDFKIALKDIKIIMMPKMTKDNQRLWILKNTGKTFVPSFMINFLRYGVIWAEYMTRHDYATGHHFIIDYRDVNLIELAAKLYLNELRQSTVIFMDSYGMRVKGIHIITQSKMVDIIVTLFKQVLSPKIGERIQIYQDIESVVQLFGEDILPADLGGREKSVEKLEEDWLEVLSAKEHVEYQREMNAARTDESLRHRDTFNQQYMGMPGTFRTLSVD